MDAGFVVDAYVKPPDAAYVDPGPAICEADPDAPTLQAAVRSAGSRLVPRAFVGADGVAATWTLHDTLLDVDCTPAVVPGTTDVRCVPTDTYGVADTFADVDHTMRVLIVTAPPRQGALAVRRSSTDLDLFYVGGMHAGSEFYWAGNTAPQPLVVGTAMYDLTPASVDLVAFTGSVAKLSDSIAVQQWQGADGSRWTGFALCDVVHDVPVSLQAARLRPPRVPRLPHTKLTPITSCSAGPPSDPLFPVTATTGCGAPNLRYVTDEFGKTFNVTEQTGTLYSCIYGDAPPQPSSGVQTFSGACNEVPAQTWQAVTTEVIGTGRLTYDDDRVDGNSLPTPGLPAFKDTSLGIDCVARRATDGTIRCLPMINGGFIGYSDASCTQEIVVASILANPPFILTPSSISSPLLETKVTVRAVGAARGTAVWYTRSGANCIPQSAQPTFDLGAETSPTTFAELQIVDAPTN